MKNFVHPLKLIARVALHGLSQHYTVWFIMLVNKTKAAEIAGVSRRTFYNHIPEKGISIIQGDDGNEKIDISELMRVYGHETIQQNLKKLEDAQHNMSNGVQAAQQFTANGVQYELFVAQQKLENAEKLIAHLERERVQILQDKEKTQEQLDKALTIGAPIGKLLTDQRESNEGRVLIERRAIEEQIKREAAEKKLKQYAQFRKTDKEIITKLKAELKELRERPLLKRLLG